MLFRIYPEPYRSCNSGSDGDSSRFVVQISRRQCICVSPLYRMSANRWVTSKPLIILLIYEIFYQVTTSAVADLTIRPLISGPLADFTQNFRRRNLNDVSYQHDPVENNYTEESVTRKYQNSSCGFSSIQWLSTFIPSTGENVRRPNYTNVHLSTTFQQ